MMRHLFRHPIARAKAARLRWLPALLWTALALIAAAALRSSAHGADRALQGAFGGVAVPLLALACLGVVSPEGTLREAARPLVLLGAPARRAALAIGVTAVVLSAALSGALGGLVAAVAHGPSDPPLGLDFLAVSAGVGALGGAAYASYFAMGTALFGKQGGPALFVVDLVLGSLGAGALLTPRAHLRALLGGLSPAHLPPRADSVALLVMVAAFLAVATWRSRPR